jgi:hypothetical protein
VAGLVAFIPFASFICLFFVPETPAWLAKRGLYEDAQQSLTWLRGDRKQVGISKKLSL